MRLISPPPQLEPTPQEPIKDDITSDIVYDNLENKDWLSVANTAKPVLNIAVGYRWVLKENIMFLNALPERKK